MSANERQQDWIEIQWTSWTFTLLEVENFRSSIYVLFCFSENQTPVEKTHDELINWFMINFNILFKTHSKRVTKCLRL